MPHIRLKPKREASVVRFHPWIFSGAIADVVGNPEPGSVVAVEDSAGKWLAWAAYSPESQIRARVWSWDRADSIDAGFVVSRLHASIARREAYQHRLASNAVRLVHGESDGLPGLVVDRLGDACVVQLSSWGVEVWRDPIVQCLSELPDISWVVERSDSEVRHLEGLPERTGLLYGPLLERVELQEGGLRYEVDILAGHKTGAYLDQRANRAEIRNWVQGCDVLDAFCYTGGFGLNALAGGAAAVTFLDSSQDALIQVQANLQQNGLQAASTDIRQGDVFQVLRQFRDAAASFDVIVLDPPKFAPTRSHAEKAARAYKDINLLAFKLLRPGGRLFTFSCSGGIDADLFQKIVAGAALDARVRSSVLAHLEQDIDHPVALHFPEGAYLKGLHCILT